MIVSSADAIRRVHEIRNRVHPGRCIRESFSFPEVPLPSDLGLVYVSTFGVLGTFGHDAPDRIEVELPMHARVILNRFGSRFQVDEDVTLDKAVSEMTREVKNQLGVSEKGLESGE
jgi:hypothetical protein